ncbi:excinuclease ABC subunit C [Sphingopyxis lindanitolerans]|uniref:Excinuclease ABC subunit C n=1 Tax=Sphingopyxis lindanitolerans TaxID=2054227 RepID=A0A2S8B227_9SPHN|nr:GIY-YIG nuclease family protein [Sphingopyxis lindanitolerans]PQM26400.1 excinuclease ABC subunit C [Sphingopyxis lindanitolerans]
MLTNRGNQLFYIGVTSDIAARMMQHRAGAGSAHCQRYNIRKLVHVEFCSTMHEAIAREKALKEWHRDWKRRLIDESNPEWDDLFDRILG